MLIQFYRCDHCGAERTSAPVRPDQWFELDVMQVDGVWPRMQFRAWCGGKAGTHLCSPTCLRAWVEHFMENQLKEKEKTV
jgi:hypothetical protein